VKAFRGGHKYGGSDKTQHTGRRGRGSGDNRGTARICSETGKGGTVKFYEKGSVRVHYEEAGSGFPLMPLPACSAALRTGSFARQSKTITIIFSMRKPS